VLNEKTYDPHCIHSEDWGHIKTKVAVICKERIADKKESHEFETFIVAQLKDQRNSIKNDFEKAEVAAKETFVTKDEAKSMIRVFYFFIAAVISYLMRDLVP